MILNSISLFDSIVTLISLPDFFSIPESTLNPVLVHREIESPIFYDHIPLMGKVCEHQFFGLDPIFEPISTPTFESRLDLGTSCKIELGTSCTQSKNHTTRPNALFWMITIKLKNKQPCSILYYFKLKIIC